MIDTHAHLDACDMPAAELLERARTAGVTRVVTIGTGIASCERSLAIAEANPGVSAALGVDPHQAATPEAGRVDELRELLDHPCAVAVGETGLDAHHGANTMREQRIIMRDYDYAYDHTKPPARDFPLFLDRETGLDHDPGRYHERVAKSRRKRMLAHEKV